MEENKRKSPKDFMYINENYMIDNTLPEHLLSYISELEEYYKNDDWLGFDCLLEGMEGTIKSYRLNGIITERQLDVLFRRYGIR